MLHTCLGAVQLAARMKAYSVLIAICMSYCCHAVNVEASYEKTLDRLGLMAPTRPAAAPTAAIRTVEPAARLAPACATPGCHEEETKAFPAGEGRESASCTPCRALPCTLPSPALGTPVLHRSVVLVARVLSYSYYLFTS